MHNTPRAGQRGRSRARRTRAARRKAQNARSRILDEFRGDANGTLVATMLAHGVTRLLAGPEVPLVLRLPVELAEQPVLLPGEVRPADQAALTGADLELERRRRELPAVQDHPAAGFADALTPAVRGHHRAGGTAAAGHAGEMEEPRTQGVVGQHPPAQCGVQSHDRRLVRQRAGEVQRRPHRIGDRQAVQEHPDLGLEPVVVKTDLDAGEQRLGTRGQDLVDVRPAPQPAQLTGAHEAAEFPVGATRGDRIAAEQQFVLWIGVGHTAEVAGPFGSRAG